MATPQPKMTRYFEASQVFTPGAPIDDSSLFAGRKEQIKDIINAVGQRGQHAVIYGERGVGKTSLANVIEDFFAGLPSTVRLRCHRINCDPTDDFFSIWRKAFRELDIELGDFSGSPEDVRYMLQEIDELTLLVVDELDRVEDADAVRLMADTIKTLSDHSTRATLGLVGVADSIDELVEDHASVERAMVQIKMPRMSDEELREIVERGCERLDMECPQDVSSRIARLSEGLPHYTHLLALHATQRAITDDRTSLSNADVDAAVGVGVEKAQHSILNAYQLATRSPRPESLFQEVLLACALAPKDDLGYFTAAAVREPFSRIMGRPYEIPAFAKHLNAFASEARGNAIEKKGKPRSFFYRFANPLLQPFVILNGIAKGLIADSLVRDLQQRERVDDDLVIDDPTETGRLF